MIKLVRITEAYSCDEGKRFRRTNSWSSERELIPSQSLTLRYSETTKFRGQPYPNEKTWMQFQWEVVDQELPTLKVDENLPRCFGDVAYLSEERSVADNEMVSFSFPTDAPFQTDWKEEIT